MKIIYLLLAGACCAGTALTGRAAVLPAAQDSSSSKGKLTLAANKAATLRVSSTHNAFVLFDLTDLPPGAAIRYARLRLFLPRARTPGAGLAVHRVTASWDETLASAEPAFDAAVLATLAADGLLTKRFISADVTATAQAWLAAPAGNQGFAITAVPGATTQLTANVLLGAKEGSGIGYPAELEIELNSDVAPGAIGTTELTDGSVTTEKLAPGSVGSTQLGSNLTLAGNIQIPGLIFQGSGTGTSEPPDKGLIIRRVKTTDSSAGSVVARLGASTGLTLERDGTFGGWRIGFPGNNDAFFIAATGVTNTGATVTFYTTSVGAPPAGTITVFTDAQNVTYFRCQFAQPFNVSEQTTVELSRFGSGGIWLGTLISTTNQ
jgi:TGF-beta propeptide